ncbi:MAG: YggT family protein [Erythrobacter sp.]|nr:YggT family protein [Erythrobacter sp.]
MQALNIVVGLLEMLSSVLIMLIIVQFIIGLAFAFNVVSPSNDFLRQVYDSIDKLLSPVLRPIRNIMPDTGAIDFSPIVLIFGLRAVVFVLESLVKY